jgi:hypothetical protein
VGYWSDVSLREYTSSDMATCAKHVLDPSLLDRLSGRFSDDDCSFCAVTGSGVAVPVNDLLAIGIEKVQEEFSLAAEYGAGLESIGFSYEAGHDTGDALGEVLEGALDDPLLVEVCSCGSDQMWVPDSFLYLDAQQRMAATWDDFVATVKHRRRFWFSASSPGADPEKLNVSDFFSSIADLLTGPEIAVPLLKGSSLIRGRMVHADADPAKFDAKALGSPPVERAAANRMSPAGLSMFYGGDTPEVMVAEIGAHSTYDHAIYGTFATLRDLTIIDLTSLPPIPGYYSVAPDRLLIAFLHDFVADLVKPITLDGREHIDYVPTQIVTEYLRYFTELEIHGLRFASSQYLGGFNIVLFCDSTNCVNPPGSDLDQDGWPAPEVLEEVTTKFPSLLPWLQLDPASVTMVKTVTSIAGPK